MGLDGAREKALVPDLLTEGPPLETLLCVWDLDSKEESPPLTNVSFRAPCNARLCSHTQRIRQCRRGHHMHVLYTLYVLQLTFSLTSQQDESLQVRLQFDFHTALSVIVCCCHELVLLLLKGHSFFE